MHDQTGEIVLRFHFTPEDLARTTMTDGPDPLWEVLLSLHMLQINSGQISYGDWRRDVQDKIQKLDLVPLREVAPPVGYSPDFLTPVNAGSGLDELLDRVLSTPGPKIHSEVEYLATRRGETRWTIELAQAGAGSMRRLGEAVRSYFDIALRPYWQSIRHHVVADRARRVQTWISHGIDQMLSTLHRGVRWNPPVLEIADFADADVYLAGRGLILQPSFFCWQTPTKLRDPDLPPILVYPTQPPPGTLFRQRPSRRLKLAALLGTTRAVALEATISGCSTSDLARRCRVSLAAASQQATILREAALITTRREGPAVRHEITPLGLSLLDG